MSRLTPLTPDEMTADQRRAHGEFMAAYNGPAGRACRSPMEWYLQMLPFAREAGIKAEIN